MAAGIQLDRVTLGYRRQPAVRGLDGFFEPGSLTAVVGPNGAGKSTLLKAIAGLLTPLEGRIHWHGARSRDAAYLPQQTEIDRSFPISVIDTVLTGCWRRTGLFSPIASELGYEAERALAAVGLSGFGRRSIGTLSVGQFQRVLFARLLLQDCPVILLDEPFAAVDERTQAELLGVVANWHRQGRTVIAVVHDLEQAREHFSHALLIAGEAIAWGDTCDVLQGEHLSRAGRMTGLSERPFDISTKSGG